MLYSFILSAWRNLTHNRWFSLLNIAGLAIGTAASLLIVDFLVTELSFDDSVPQKDQVYRLYEKYPSGSTANLVPGIAPILQGQIPEIEQLARILPTNGIISDPENEFDPGFFGESNELFYADPDFPLIMGLKAIEGEVDLDNPSTTILSEKQATEWFGSATEAIGKQLLFKDQFGLQSYLVKGVFETLPYSTHIRPDMILSHHTLIPTRYGWDDLNGFGWGSFFYYLKLSPGSSPKQAEDLIAETRERLFAGEPNPGRLTFQPLSDVHFDTFFSYDVAETANTDQLLIMSGLGFFILLIAWLNYVNMATARSLDRSREVGVRKSVGASRPQLITQFLLEAALINLFAVGLSILIMDLTADSFAEITGQQKTLQYWEQGWFWGFTLTLFVIGTIASGLYPAFFLSGFNATKVLKSDVSARNGKPRLRQALVMVQFVLSMILLSGAYSVYQQMNYVENQHASLDTHQKIAVQGPSILPDSGAGEKLEIFRQTLISNPAIQGVSLTSSLPGIGFNYGNGGVKVDSRPDQDPITCEVWYGDDQFAELYGINIVAGRNFSLDKDHHSEVVMMNETAARNLGFADPADIIGEIVDVEGPKRIVGVTEDYHHESLHSPISPSVFMYKVGFGSWYSVDVHEDHLSTTMAEIDSNFRALFPGNPTRSFYYDALYDQMYASDRDFGKTVGIFSGLAILVACLGLIGLALFSAKKRSKEIGIRKVLGASESDMVMLLSRELLILVGLAVLIATPLCWASINTWLDQFAFSFTISPAIFLIPGFVLLLLAWISVSWQTWTSARANPIDSLRHE